MNLQEATERIKAILNQEIEPNTLRKACACGRLKAVRKGEGSMHIRRTEWDVKEEGVLQFVREDYHPRPTRKAVKNYKLHIPNILESAGNHNSIDDNYLEEPAGAKVFYRVIEHLYQNTLPIHGHKLEKYDTRIVESNIRNKAKAEAMVHRLQAQAHVDNLSDQLRYEMEVYNSIRKLK